MPNIKVCFAQALDNISPDYVFVNENSVHDEQERRDACSRLSSVSMNGKLIHDEDGVRLFVNGNEYVLEVQPQQLDFIDRAAPMAMCIERNDQDDADAIIKEVQKYAELMNRSVAEDRILSVKNAINKLANYPQAKQNNSRFLKFGIKKAIKFIKKLQERAL